MASTPWKQPGTTGVGGVAHPAPAGNAAGAHRRTGRVLTLFLAVIQAAGALLLMGATATYAYVARSLPSPQNMLSRQQFQTTKIYDRNGVLLHEVYDPNKGRRTEV